MMNDRHHKNPICTGSHLSIIIALAFIPIPQIIELKSKESVGDVFLAHKLK